MDHRPALPATVAAPPSPTPADDRASVDGVEVTFLDSEFIEVTEPAPLELPGRPS